MCKVCPSLKLKAETRGPFRASCFQNGGPFTWRETSRDVMVSYRDLSQAGLADKAEIINSLVDVNTAGGRGGG